MFYFVSGVTISRDLVYELKRWKIDYFSWVQKGKHWTMYYEFEEQLKNYMGEEYDFSNK